MQSRGGQVREEQSSDSKARCHHAASPALTFLGLICNNLLRCTKGGERSNVCESCQPSSRKTVTEWICMKTSFPSFRLARRPGCGSPCWEAWPRAGARCCLSLSGGHFFVPVSSVPSRPCSSISSRPPRGGVVLRKTAVRVDPWGTVPPSALPTFRVPGTLWEAVAGGGGDLTREGKETAWSQIPSREAGAVSRGGALVAARTMTGGNPNHAVRTLGD